MADLVVIVPSRGRPAAARELIEAFDETCTAGTRMVLAIDRDDPTWADYARVAWDRRDRYVCAVEPPSNFVVALNDAAAWALGWDDAPYAVGFMGDDHRPRTVGWDKAYLDALRDLGTGIVYGDDLLQREQLPTQVAMTSDIIRALGHMAPATFTHLFVDDYWKELGLQSGCLRYLPDVVVEHMHPIAGKADWDEGYKRVNAQQMYVADHAAWTRYRYMTLPGDVAKVKALRAVRT